MEKYLNNPDTCRLYGSKTPKKETTLRCVEEVHYFTKFGDIRERKSGDVQNEIYSHSAQQNVT